MLRQPIALPIPVPNAFETASLRGETRSQMARREFHRHRIFDFTVGKNTMEKTVPETIDGMLNARASRPDRLRCQAHSSGIIRHRGEHFLHGVIESNGHRTRYNRVADIQLGETRDLANQLDIFVINAVACVDLEVGF